MKKFKFDIQRFAVISNLTDNTVISGTDVGDNMYNRNSGVTINALGGNDTITNDYYAGSTVGNNVLINGGDGSDSIRNTSKPSNITVIGGKGNDTIVNESF